jgi:hypothetical protein
MLTKYINFEFLFQKYQHQWNSVKFEYITLVLFYGFENMLLILPALYTYTNIKARHQFLEETIGPLPLESIAMQRWDWIVMSSPLFVILSIPLQLGLIWAFNKYGHPWKRFFHEFSKKPKKLPKTEAIAAAYISG